ncbi:hypothetical protein ACO2KH_16650 [Leptospira terpstrae]|uniref:hypothetical protein n=1 Tax=Leptospira terpstrae TaxID=293075 RepID=UPI003CFC6A40
MVLEEMQSGSLWKGSFGSLLLLIFFYSHCMVFNPSQRNESNVSPTSSLDKESYLVLRLVRGKDKTMGIVEEIPVALTFETPSEGTKQTYRIYPLPLAKSKEPFFLPLTPKTKFQEEVLLVGCLYFFPIPNFFRGNLKLEIQHSKWIQNRDFVFQKTVPYDWQGNLTKYWEYDLDHSEILDKTIPSLSSYRHLECEDDIRLRKEIPKNGVVTPLEED